jgi:hypothetical protein
LALHADLMAKNQHFGLFFYFKLLKIFFPDLIVLRGQIFLIKKISNFCEFFLPSQFEPLKTIKAQKIIEWLYR